MFGGLEKKLGEIRWRVGVNVLGALEDTYSMIFGENVSAIWRNRFGEKTVWRFWRKLLGEIVVGDLEKSFGDFWRKPFGDVVLELVKEYRSARRSYVEIKK